jgi:hypothetical protein
MIVAGSILIFLILILLTFVSNKNQKIENWATSPGTLIQLATSRPYRSYPYRPYYYKYFKYRMPFRRPIYRRYYIPSYRGIKYYPFPFW